MDIRFSCPECGQHMVIDEAGAGMTIQCTACGHDTKVPDAVEPAPPADPDVTKKQTVALKWTPPPAIVPKK